MSLIKGLDIVKKEGYTVIKLPHLLNQDNFLEIEEEIESSMAGYRETIAIDLSECDNIFSMLITLIIHIRKKVIEAGGELCLINVSINGQQQIKAMNLDMILTMYDSEEEIDI